MVYVRLHGGLGNQLFQYAFARNLSLENGMEICLHHRHFKLDIARMLSIQKFNIADVNFSSSRYNLFVKFDNSKLNKIYNFILHPNTYCLEGRTTAPRQKISSGKDYYYDGYWQSSNYVTPIESHLRAELTLKDGISSWAKGFEDKIKNSAVSVSVHIRKTDFVTNKKNSSIFAKCESDYYVRSEKYLAEHLGQEMHFFIFSDDFDWVKKNVKLNSRYTLIQGNADFEDLYLMSLCQHNITANSTFSWWGAWLNQSREKIVITPQNWFVNGMSEENLVPSDWVRISN